MVEGGAFRATAGVLRAQRAPLGTSGGGVGTACFLVTLCTQQRVTKEERNNERKQSDYGSILRSTQDRLITMTTNIS